MSPWQDEQSKSGKSPVKSPNVKRPKRESSQGEDAAVRCVAGAHHSHLAVMDASNRPVAKKIE